jgi:hypothetical protein
MLHWLAQIEKCAVEGGKIDPVAPPQKNYPG